MVTDCKPLTAIFSEKKGVPLMAAGLLQRWAVILNAYNYKLKYVGSKQNCVADCLSRIPCSSNEEHSNIENYINFIEKTVPLNFRDVMKYTKKR